MPEEEIQIGLGVDVEGFKQQLSESEQLAQAAIARMSQMSAGEQPTVMSSPVGAPPPVPPSAPPAPSATPEPEKTGVDPISSAWAELEKIKGISEQSPDVALAGLSGRGGLLGRVNKAAIADPENEEYQRLIEAIKDQTKATKEQVRAQNDPDAGGAAAGILSFLKGNAMIGVAGNVGQQLAGGNIVGAAGTGIGAGLGFMFGGPLGAQAGAQLGGMAAGTIGQFLSGATEAQQYSMLTADIGGRFGDISGTDAALSIANIRDMDTSGYSMQETAGLFDVLRQGRAIDGVDENSKELVEQIQGLSRALGQNTEALAQNYSSYKALGGGQDADGYMAQMIAGAVSAGMRSNMEQYQEMVGSARMQLVSRSGIGDYDERGMRGIQGTLTTLLGQNNRTSELLRDNPMMAQQMLSNFLSTGATRSGLGVDASLMQLAGIDAARTTEGYIGSGQQVDNAIARQSFIAKNFLGNSLGTMGFGSQDEFFAAAQQNPNLIQDLMTDRNPNTNQARSLQTSMDLMISTTMGKPLESITAQDRQMSMQMLQAFGTTGGNITSETQTADGSSIADLITESQKTEGQMAREAAQERHDEMMKLMSEFAPLLTKINEEATEIGQLINDPIAPAMRAIAEDLVPLIRGTAGAMDSIGQFIGMDRAGEAMNMGVVGGLREVAGGNTIGGLVQVASGAAGAIEAVTPVGMMRRGTEAVGGAIANLFGFGKDDASQQSPRQEGRSPAPSLPSSPLATPQPNLLVDNIFNDTPPGGVLATKEYNTFRFAPGDVVQASMGGAAQTTSGMASPNITVQINVPTGGVDAEWMRVAAQSGTMAAFDEFTASWRGRDRGEARRDATNY
ncbi:hypothetical protein ACQ4M4_27390 [Leptolyngbya sp. AN02str]|uniref:hypothetical protein n=1 Tax=Leptolyngbya sp. AN02str TaxID=3423363 RepID=UPI003D30EF55